MFDLERWNMPRMVEAYGTQWTALYRVATTDVHHAYIAVPDKATLASPEPCSLILVPLSAKELEAVQRRKEREAAEIKK